MDVAVSNKTLLTNTSVQSGLGLQVSLTQKVLCTLYECYFGKCYQYSKDKSYSSIHFLDLPKSPLMFKVFSHAHFPPHNPTIQGYKEPHPLSIRGKRQESYRIISGQRT